MKKFFIIKNIFLFTFALIFATNIAAQDVNFSVSVQGNMAVGQQFSLIFTLNAEGSGFVGPNLDGFEVLSGPNMRSGQNVVYANGKVTQSVTTTFSYVLRATKEGNFTITSATITSKGKTYLSQPLTIRIGKGSQQSSGYQQKGQSGVAQQAEYVDENIFIKVSASNTNPYIGEPLSVVYKLYTPTSRLQVGGSEKEPSFPGFWVEDLMKDATTYKQYTENINGKKYIVVELRQFSIIPQQAGKLTIEPFVNQVVYQVKVKNQASEDNIFGNDPFFKNLFDDSFFGSKYQTITKNIKSNSLSINVKPLPLSGKTPYFSGAVGQFNVSSSVINNNTSVNQAINYKFTINGEGNLNLIEAPEINFPANFEVYEPKVTNRFTNNSKTSGSREFEYILIPRNSGEFTIEPVDFSFFNTKTGSYSNLKTNSIKIKVEKGSGVETTESGEIKAIDYDIRHIVENNLNLNKIGKSLFNSTLYWVLLSLIVVLFVTFLLFHLKELRDKKDLNALQQRRATKVAIKRLKKSKQFLDENNHDSFHEELSTALWGYISHKFNIPLSELSLTTTKLSLEQRNVNPDLISKFITVLDDCNFSRYAPKGQSIDMQTLYSSAMQVIIDTEADLNNKNSKKILK